MENTKTTPLGTSKEYLPFWSVLIPIAVWFFTTTDTPGRGAPVSSITLPDTTRFCGAVIVRNSTLGKASLNARPLIAIVLCLTSSTNPMVVRILYNHTSRVRFFISMQTHISFFKKRENQ